MQRNNARRIKPEMLLFFVLVALAALGNGFSDSLYANYYKDVYNVTASQRAFIEFPRELPGVLCAVIIGALSFLGDRRLSVIAQVLACVGLAALGLFTPAFGVMLVFLFVNSLGMHLFMPLQDSLCMEMAEKDQVGRRMGQYAALKTAIGFISGIVVFLGFRFGWFSFKTQIKGIFLIGAAAFAAAIVVAVMLVKRVGAGRTQTSARPKFVFRKEYTNYYLLTVLHGVQKQVTYVFGSWVIVDLLLKGADVMSILLIAGSFLGIFFMNMLGKWIDRFGIRKMMHLDALTFIFVYLMFGFVVWGISSGKLPTSGWPVLVIYALFVLDRLSMQLGIVKSVYLRSIAVDPADVTVTLSTGTSLDHIVSIIAAQFSGLIWTYWGPQWVFFLAAALSLGNLYVARKVKA